MPSCFAPLCCGHAAGGAAQRGADAATLMLVGLDNAGKSTVARHLKGEAASAGAMPTFGFSGDTLTGSQLGLGRGRRAKLSVELFDLGGGKNIRSIWDNYYADAHAVVYVVDAADKDRLPEAASCLAEALKDDRLRGKPLVVLANKQDVPEAIEPAQVAQALGLAEGGAGSPLGERAFNIVGCTALYQEGDRPDPRLRKALSWLLDAVDAEWEQLGPLVERQVAEQKEAEKKRMAEKRARVEKMREERRIAQEEEERKAKEAEEAGTDQADGAQGPDAAESDAVDGTVGAPIEEAVSPISLPLVAAADAVPEAGGAAAGPADDGPPRAVDADEAAVTSDVDEASAPEANPRINPVAKHGGSASPNDMGVTPVEAAADPNALPSPRGLSRPQVQPLPGQPTLVPNAP